MLTKAKMNESRHWRHHVNCLPLQWRHNGHDSVSNHQHHDCLLNRLYRRRSKKTSKLRVTGLCAGNSPGTGEFPAQMASNTENVSIWWRHHAFFLTCMVWERWFEIKKYAWWCMFWQHLSWCYLSLTNIPQYISVTRNKQVSQWQDLMWRKILQHHYATWNYKNPMKNVNASLNIVDWWIWIILLM